MKIGIISFAQSANIRTRFIPENEKLLVEAIKRRGHEPKVFRSSRFEMYYSNKKNDLFYGGKKMPDVDVMIPRPSITNEVDIQMTLNKHCLLMGIPLLNGYMPVLRAKNKVRTLQILGHKGIPVPKTVVLSSFKYIDSAVKRVGGYPVIVKIPVGSLGKGVAIVESRRSLLSSLDIFWASSAGRKSLLIQEYVEEANGCDIRVFVVGDKIIASMQRTAKEGEFRSNMKLGGKGSLVELTHREIEMALDATKALNLDVAGVDILRTKHGPVVMEMNANPGLKGIIEVTGVDVAGAIVDAAVAKVSDGHVDRSHRSLGLNVKVDEPYAVV